MLSSENSERLAHVGPGTPMGAALRRYWFPALLSEELAEPDGAPVRVRLLGEDLIAFRDTRGDVGLVSAYCPHRRAPMFFGRNEDCGLRCVYHGWKFDRTGACVDMPSEPADSLFKSKVRIAAYPTFEGGGIVWTCLGDDPPPPPEYEPARVPATHRVVSKTFEDCNYQQALEGGLDNVHAAILHRRSVDGDLSFLRDYHRADTARRACGAPPTATPSRPYGRRTANSGHASRSTLCRRCSCAGPCRWATATTTGLPTMDGHIWVPIDDFHTWVYNFTYSYFPDEPLPHDLALELEIDQGRGPGEVGPDYKLVRNRANDYLIDRAMQKRGNFTGIVGVNTQDYALQENMEPIVDRTKEHLSAIDQPIIVMRQLLLEACDDAAACRPARGADPATHRVRAADHFIAAGLDWADALKAETEALY